MANTAGGATLGRLVKRCGVKMVVEECNPVIRTLLRLSDDAIILEKGSESKKSVM